MATSLPACLIIFGLGLGLTACSKQPSSQVPAAVNLSSPQAAPRQPAGVSSASAPPNAPAAAAPAVPQTATAAVPAAPAPESQSADAPPLVASDETQGPFRIGDQSFTFAKHVQKIQGLKSSDDATVEWWELRDANSKAVYRKQYGLNFQNGRFGETEDIGARELKTKFGQGILVEGQSLPSAPNTGSWVQVFGLSNQKIVPLSNPIGIDGDFLGEDVDSYQPSAMFRGQQPHTVSRDILKFRMWTGNFNIIYGVTIDWMQATVRPAWTCMRTTSQGPSSACIFKVELEPTSRTELSFVRLFAEPDTGLTPRHVVIKPESKLEFIEAQASVAWSSDQNNTSFGLRDSDKVWLHIKVDGEDGWISGEEDFEAVGLPQAG